MTMLITTSAPVAAEPQPPGPAREAPAAFGDVPDAVVRSYKSPDAPLARKAVHIPALDGLRGLAILLVLIFHYAEFSANGSRLELYLRKLTSAGWVGVDLFFVLSGFLITSILYEAKASPGYFKNFYMRRVLRIFPLYYGVLVVAFVIVPLFINFDDTIYDRIARRQGWLWAYLQNYVQVPGSWKAFQHFWSLAVEEQFYLVWPAVVFLLNRRVLMGVCGVMIVAALAIRIWRVDAGFDPHMTYYFTPSHMDALAIGGLLALASHGRRGVKSLATPALVVAIVSGVLLVSIAVAARGFFYGLPLVQKVGYSVLAVFCGSLLVRVVAASPTSLLGRVFNNAGLRFLGKYSYGLYVFQGMLMSVVAWLLPLPQLARQLHSHVLAVAVYFVVGSGLSLACALASWHLYEKHFLKLKRFFEYRAATLRQPVRDAVAPPPGAEVRVTAPSPTAM